MGSQISPLYDAVGSQVNDNCRNLPAARCSGESNFPTAFCSGESNLPAALCSGKSNIAAAIETKFEKNLGYESGPKMDTLVKKTRAVKSRATVPFRTTVR